uniref:Uncharacterized protein n=1 Tax=Anguilla anguilla TaxID=7936 RepID=A0A0E9XFN7_ANGAN
MASSLFCTY